MSAVLYCQAAEENAVVDTFAMADLFVARGDDVTVVFSGGALSAMHEGTFHWSHPFRGREARAVVMAGAESLSRAFADRSRDPRWSDVRSLVAACAQKERVTLVACPVWLRLLKIEVARPPLQSMTEDELWAALKAADVVMGGC